LYCSDACRQQACYRRRKARPVYFRSRSDEWATPWDLFARLDAEFHFTLDVCATAGNAKCQRYFTKADDGLAQTWSGYAWCNPPYSEVARWMAKALEAARTTAELVVCLVPARTDTAWWHDVAAQGEVRFLRGRLRFGDSLSGAPFPSVIVVFREARMPHEMVPKTA
jgi:phage N-6-adenine-methyltransferase